MTDLEKKLLNKIRILIVLFIAGLVLSGITAFPLTWELSLLRSWSVQLLGYDSGITFWFIKVDEALRDTYSRYPFIPYGTDWLAFAHIVIGVNFIGPLLDPAKNKWVIQSGIIACAMVFPLAFIAGAARSIPFAWQLIDCSFGIIGGLLLIYIHNLIKKFEKMKEENLRIQLYTQKPPIEVSILPEQYLKMKGM